MLNWDIENQYLSSGYKTICGCDEAGRGPLAGPVFAAAVILPEGLLIDGLDDSKKLNEAKRLSLYKEIKEKAVAFAVGRAEVEEIEAINILNASMLAMNRAISALSPIPDFALVDGNIARGLPVPAVPVIKGDGKSPSIAAAAILAKVERDAFCLQMDELHPLYGFAKHKGYGTKQHRQAIIEHGACPLHRLSFLKGILNEAS